MSTKTSGKQIFRVITIMISTQTVKILNLISKDVKEVKEKKSQAIPKIHNFQIGKR